MMHRESSGKKTCKLIGARKMFLINAVEKKKVETSLCLSVLWQWEMWA